MKTCPRCGAENIQTAVTCHKCAAELESPESSLAVTVDIPVADELPSTVVISGDEPEHQHAPSSSFAGHGLCPTCNEFTEPAWQFCKNCGNELKDS
jgi:predicted amidophosphoribosyltransferase